MRILVGMIAAFILSVILVAQGYPAPGQAAVPEQGTPLQNGPCLDSRPVPAVLQQPLIRGNQITRIDKVESTATMMPGEVIGYLYSLADGTEWLGQREDIYMSAAAATQINTVLSSTHMPGNNVSKFPPQMKHGVATKYTQFYQVQIPQTAMNSLRIQLVECVVWPGGRPLPDPSM